MVPSEHFIQIWTNVPTVSVGMEPRAATVLGAILASVRRVSRIKTVPQVALVWDKRSYVICFSAVLHAASLNVSRQKRVYK